MRARIAAQSALCALALAAIAIAGCSAYGAKCPACERPECRNMAFTIHLQDGRAVETCCPRCGLRFMASQRLSAASLSVRAFDTAATLDATRAYYVEGSDISPCTAQPSKGPKDERGCCGNPVYDRCMPSLLAFPAREAAAEFARAHGGEIRTFEQIRAEQP